MDSLNTSQLIVQLFGVFAPIVRSIIAERHVANETLPTDDEIKAKFASDIEHALAEGDVWTALHPRPPTS